MRRLLIIFAILLLFPFISKGDNPFVIQFQLKDRATGQPLMGHIELFYLGENGVPAKAPFATMDLGVNGTADHRFTKRPTSKMRARYQVYSKYVYEVGARMGVLSESYETSYQDFEVPDSASSPVIVELYADMKPETGEEGGRVRELGEVTVTASKVMFYHKGDTLIYNADAFVMDEGSTLDALISKLPGVTLNPQGVISVNGRKVDVLMLNGKNMFNDRNELMLENIAAYTVKDIAVYEKRTREAELMDINVGRKDYVMDVRLKREYSVGGSMNAEGGYGSHERYLGKIFGMWFSDFTSMTAYGNANNLSTSKVPGADDSAFKVDSQDPTGVQTSQRGGVTYVAKGFKDRWELTGGVDVLNTDRIYNEDMYSEIYRTGGNEQVKRLFSSRNKSLTFSTTHHYFTKIGRRVIFDLYPEFSYGKKRNDQHDETTSRDENENLINRRGNEKISRERYDGLKVKAETRINLSDGKFQPTMLTIGAQASYTGNHGEDWQRYRYTFGDEQLAPIYSHLYRDNRPDNSKLFRTNMELTHFLTII